MKWTREFEIAFVGLKPGEHHFNYKIEDSFFEHFAPTDFENSAIDVKLLLDKKSDIFLLHFDIHGSADTICDRCGDPMRINIWDEFDHVIKLVNEDDVEDKNDEDPDITYISRSDSLLDVSTMVYEDIILSFPIQKVHKPMEEGGKGCNEETLKILNEQTKHTSNNMWDALKNKLKN